MAVQYTIVKGDTLTKIARRFGVSLKDLIAANPQIRNPDLIFIGDKLTIPIEQESPPGEPAQEPDQQQQEPAPVPPDESPAPPPLAGTPEAPGVWSGGTLVRVARENADDVWAMVYEWPKGSGQYLAWTFDSQEQMLATLGSVEDAGGFQVWTDDQFRSRTTVAGNAAEITGPGSFDAWIGDMLEEVRRSSGIADPTLWGRYVSDPEVSRLLVRAAAEGWSEQQLLGELRNTSFYRDVLYPGIEQFFGLDDPEQAWYAYYANVVSGLEALGVDPGPDGSYRGIVGQMLRQRVDDVLFADMTNTFIRAQSSPEYAEILDEWFQSELGRSLDFDTFFDVLSGQTTADVREVVEKATLAYQSQVQGVDITDEDIRRIASARQGIDDRVAADIFTSYARALQAVSGVLGRYGITADEILSAAAGIESPTGRSLEEIQRLTRQAAREAGQIDDEKLDVFLSFTPLGTPQRPGLGTLAPEGA